MISAIFITAMILTHLIGWTYLLQGQIEHITLVSLFFLFNGSFSIYYLNDLNIKNYFTGLFFGAIGLLTQDKLYSSAYYKRNGYIIPTRKNREKKLLRQLSK